MEDENNPSKKRNTIRVKKTNLEDVLTKTQALENPISLLNNSALEDENRSLGQEYALLSEVLEKSEEEDFPEYEIKGTTLVREGRQVTHDELLNDYDRLKTELRRLEKLSSVLYTSTLNVDKKLVNTVKGEAQKRKKQALFITSILLITGIAVVLGVLYIKGQREKQLIANEEKTKREKEVLQTELKVRKDKADETLSMLESLAKNSDLQKQQFELEKQKELENLKKKLAEGSLSEDVKAQILAEAEKKYQLQQREVFSQLEEQRKALEQQRLAYSDEKKKLEEDRKKLEEENSKKLEQLKKTLAQQDLSEKERQKRLSEERTRQTQEEIKQQKELLAQLDKQSQVLEKQRETMEKDRVEREKAFRELTRQMSKPKEPPVTVDIPIGESTSGTPKEEIQITGNYDGRKLMEGAYHQKMVNTEIVNAVIFQGNKRYSLAIYSKNDHSTSTTKELLKISEPSGLKGNAYLSIIDARSGDRKAWHYEASEHKVTRINTNQLQDKMLESEFSYEDWVLEHMNNYNYTYKKTVQWRGGRTAHVVLCEPKESEKEKTQYSKKYYWIDSQIGIPLEIKYFGKDNKLSKIFAVKKMSKVGEQSINGKAIECWRPMSAFIVNAKTQSKTSIEFEKWRINRELSEDIFTPHSLSATIKLPER